MVRPDTSLLNSIAVGHLDSVSIIIASNPLSEKSLHDALTLAITTCKKSIALYLLSSATGLVRSDIFVDYGDVLMRWAIEEGNVRLVERLLLQGVDANAKVFKMNTCLHLAVTCEHYEIVSFTHLLTHSPTHSLTHSQVTMLIEHGASLDIENENNLKPLAVFRSVESKTNYFIRTTFPESLLLTNSHIFWFRLVQLSDVDGSFFPLTTHSLTHSLTHL